VRLILILMLNKNFLFFFKKSLFFGMLKMILVKYSFCNFYVFLMLAVLKFKILNFFFLIRFSKNSNMYLSTYALLFSLRNSLKKRTIVHL
jgi:hypothetical protein